MCAEKSDVGELSRRGRRKSSRPVPTPKKKKALSLDSPKKLKLRLKVKNKQLLVKLKTLELAPSRITSHDDALSILSCILGRQYRDLTHVREFILSRRPPLLPPDNRGIEPIHKLLCDTARCTLDISSSEACGYPLLGNYLYFMRTRLAELLEDPNLPVYVHHQTNVWLNCKRGSNPSVDSSLIYVRPTEDPGPMSEDAEKGDASSDAEKSESSSDEDDEGDASPSMVGLVNSNTRIPLALFEYKPIVSHTVNMIHICELFMQAFYSFQLYDMRQCLFCLTDMTIWRYFLISISDDDVLDVQWSHEIFTERPLNPTQVELATHFGFVVCHLQEAITHTSSSPH